MRQIRLSQGDARQRFALNVLTNVAYVVLVSAVMLAYVPFLVKSIGIAAFGIVPLAQLLVQYAATVTESLATAISRYLTIDLNRRDWPAANRTFNTALAVTMAAAGILLPLVIALTWAFPALFQVPPGLEAQSQLVFACVGLSFVASMLEASFTVSAQALHRFDLRNALLATVVLTRVGTVVAAMSLLVPQLWLVGLGFLVSAVVSLAGSWWLCRVITPELRIDLSLADRSRSGDLLAFGGWAIVNRTGMVLFLTADLIIINTLLGPVAGGQFAALILFPELIRSFSETIGSVLSPVIMGRYALSDHRGLHSLAGRTVRLFAIGLALPVGLLCGLAGPLLAVWLGPEYRHLSLLLVIMVAPLAINLATLPLSYVLSSYGKLRVQGLMTIALAALNIALAIAVARWTAWGAVGVAALSGALLAVRNLVFLSSYSARIMGRPMATFYYPVLRGVLAMILIAVAAHYIASVLGPATLLALAALGLLLVAAILPVLYGLALDRADRVFLRRLIPLRLRLRLPRLHRLGPSERPA